MLPAHAPLFLEPDFVARLDARISAAERLLQSIVEQHAPVAFANSLGAEDMVLTDLIRRLQLPITVFSLDTGRLPDETYALMAEIQRRYGLRLELYAPRHEALETYTRTHGVNAFYDSVELRKACCQIRKVEPLQRALHGRGAWITGMRAAQSATRTNLQASEFDATHQLPKFNPLAAWSESEVWGYLHRFAVPYNVLHERFYPSIGCAPCTRAVAVGEDVRAGRWWWESPESKECGLHVRAPESRGATA